MPEDYSSFLLKDTFYAEARCLKEIMDTWSLQEKKKDDPAAEKNASWSVCLESICFDNKNNKRETSGEIMSSSKLN